MKGLILCGGMGTRLQPLTHTIPKQVLPIANKPMVEYSIEQLATAGIKDIYIIVGNNPGVVKKVLGSGFKWGVQLTYIQQNAPRGLAHAVNAAEPLIGAHPFALVLGDNLFGGDMKGYINKFIDSSFDAMVMVAPVNDPSNYGIVSLDGDEVKSAVEKPEKADSNMALTGLYFFRRGIFEAINRLKPSWRGELEITDAINCLAGEGEVAAGLLKGWWLDAGNRKGLLKANRLMLNRTGIEIGGKVISSLEIKGGILDKAKNSLVGGPVRIGVCCNIEYASIGQHTSIGNGVTLKNVTLENTIVMSGAVLKGPINFKDCVIGPGAEVENGARPMSCAGMLIGEKARIRWGI